MTLYIYDSSYYQLLILIVFFWIFLVVYLFITTELVGLIILIVPFFLSVFFYYFLLSNLIEMMNFNILSIQINLYLISLMKFVSVFLPSLILIIFLIQFVALSFF